MSSIEHFSQEADQGEVKTLTDSTNERTRKNLVEDAVMLEQSVLERAEREKQHQEQGIEAKQERFERHKEKVEQLRANLDTHKSNFIKKILERKRIAELQFELGVAEVNLGDAERDKKQAEELIQQYEKIIGEEQEVNALLDEAYAENREFDARKQAEFREEEAGRDVKNLAQKHNVFFVHDIVVADWKPSENNLALNTKQLGFKDQLNIVMGLEPTISVSTLSPGSKNRTFGDGAWGVFLSSGRVLGGESSDAATVATGLRERSIHKGREGVDSIAEAIQVNTAKNYRSYNELVLEKPEVAGIYCQWDDRMPELIQDEDIFLSNTRERGYDRWWKYLEESMSTGAPLFVVAQDKTVRNIYNIDLEKRSFRVSGVWKPEDMVDAPGYLQQHHSPDARARAVREVLAKAPQIVPEEEQRLAKENPGYYGNSLNIH